MWTQVDSTTSTDIRIWSTTLSLIHVHLLDGTKNNNDNELVLTCRTVPQSRPFSWSKSLMRNLSWVRIQFCIASRDHRGSWANFVSHKATRKPNWANIGEIDGIPNGLLESRDSEECSEIGSVRGDNYESEEPPRSCHYATGDVLRRLTTASKNQFIRYLFRQKNAHKWYKELSRDGINSVPSNVNLTLRSERSHTEPQAFLQREFTLFQVVFVSLLITISLIFTCIRAY